MYIVIWYEDGKKHSQKYASLGGAERRAAVLRAEGAYHVEVKALN